MKTIVDCARDIAENNGRAAETTRRLANEIEYSAPVLYSHFPDCRDGIVSAVALIGLRDFTYVMLRRGEFSRRLWSVQV
ncbi:hypothetical protein [Rhodococcus opacus]|uniref:TetR family transcriptional regulator n=1 Tax=Rhodococcus opacus TaxID=37919 RepID=A0A076ED25_RHOOP|nr:hypothetical protein [Rhodococcus opacus]AII03521.1 hypothetical protein EP51_02390 [Rhodococcus opacus]